MRGNCNRANKSEAVYTTEYGTRVKLEKEMGCGSKIRHGVCY